MTPKSALIAAGLFAGLAACTVVPSVEAGAAPDDSQPVAPRTVAAPPAPAPASTPTTPARTDFTYSGELTQGGWIRGQAPSNAVSATLGETPLLLDEEGNFFAAFDRDAGTSELLVATLANGETVTRELTVLPRDWDIERVNVARRAGGASESFMRRRQPELDAIWDARIANSDTNGWKEDFIWPLTGRISGRFGSQRIYRGEPGSYHSGIDIATGGSGNPFVAPASGVVTLAVEDFSLEGNLLIIDHGAGLNSAFLHLSEIAVEEGDRVEQGQLLGRIGSSGRATGPHLHWSLKWHLTRLDPILFTGPMP
ncbi:M23 family metallopeptidase [Aurantiacibacter poecillastricola]|uniref:M23 family metallopeptidase n=1 Tax=Aurantiacibacter poecillastricola TaxID=3064385 RepID=UPI00273F144F|nr:M23 family metallopeptidase [Aurantiacibacter sp. 219JJ12-13]MDP5260565.1 M23 family metallopeptidase [Aurantiacibacter sp. 219JJ12-13]